MRNFQKKNASFGILYQLNVDDLMLKFFKKLECPLIVGPASQTRPNKWLMHSSFLNDNLIDISSTKQAYIQYEKYLNILCCFWISVSIELRPFLLTFELWPFIIFVPSLWVCDLRPVRPGIYWTRKKSIILFLFHKIFWVQTYFEMATWDPLSNERMKD